MPRFAHALAVLLIATSVAGCSSGSSDEANSDDATSKAYEPKDCAEVWVDGQVLPADYQYCLDLNLDAVYSGVVECSNGTGTQILLPADPDYSGYAALGEKVLSNGSAAQGAYCG